MRKSLKKMVEEQSAPQSIESINERRAKRMDHYGEKREISGFDIDGVITAGIFPGPNDVIITGRSYCMAKETFEMLHAKGIYNPVYFNPEHRIDNTRVTSGQWKAKMLNQMDEVKTFFEDDPVQAAEIEKLTTVKVIYIISDQEK